MTTTLIKKSSIQKEGPYLASKWHKLYFLLSKSEFIELFEGLEFSIHPLGGIIKEKDLFISFEKIASSYGTNLTAFYKEKKAFKMPSYLLTNNRDALYIIDGRENEVMLKIKKPVLYLKPHFFTISEGKVHATLGKEAIYWGFCLSYPQIFQDPETKKFEKINKRYSNTDLFITLRKKLRSISSCITFLVNDKKVVSSYRLGKELALQTHPDLKRKNIVLYGDADEH